MSTPVTVHAYGSPDAPVAVVLHGLSDSGESFPDLVTRWAGSWRILAPDMRAHGRSPRFTPEELPASGELMLQDVLEVVDGQPRPVVLLGHSMGAVLALRAAVARPDRVRGLVLEDPPHPSGGPSPVDVGAGFESFVVEVSGRVDQLDQLRAESRWSATEVDAWALSKPQVQREYLRHGLHLGEQGWDELIGALFVPTLLVLPDSGSAAPTPPDPDESTADDAADPVARSPHVRPVVVADSGHCVRRDQPDAYHRVVEEFLAGLPPA